MSGGSGSSTTTPSATPAVEVKELAKNDLNLATKMTGPKTTLQCSIISDETKEDTSRSYLDDPGVLNLGQKKVLM